MKIASLRPAWVPVSKQTKTLPLYQDLMLAKVFSLGYTYNHLGNFRKMPSTGPITRRSNFIGLRSEVYLLPYILLSSRYF
jgi:hypothetical protein